ncbi:MAG TPA: RNA polymerase sigma factor [Anaerolineaceae bacterium]|nr:RNA polymerase sigma factor [Anaerolineaceae bacterium]
MGDTLNNEARIVERAIAGDFDSFAVLYSCHLEAIYRYIFFRTGEPQDAEDLTEQVFLKAWEALPHYRPVGRNFINWLYRIAHNHVVDFHRRRNLVAMETLRDDIDKPDPVQEDALESIIQVEERERLAYAIQKLPDEHQQVILLRFIEGLAHADVARILEKSEAACRVIQHQALASLSKQLEEGLK